MAYGVKALIDQRIAAGEAPAEPAVEPDAEVAAELTEIEAPAAEAADPAQASEKEE